ncbi:hypothetical protein B5E77_02760 [Lachnoclostridium sp. An131]|uniref:hypothetical protein n=1 Tax=Lachnoclostridium sp. An131 TaxID=1965555 RepID=UPI000B37BA26|nr:hypothetical protein [Lachnoclostridium sp. An131]OUQ28690.1 hypothetical protein B5E77_02760 [Lachnoclostridium sp. An131]
MDLEKRYQELSSTITKEHSEVFKLLSMDELQKALDIIKKTEKIFVFAAGREGISLRGFAMRLAHLGKKVYWVFDDTTIGITPGDLYITSEGSGEVGSFDYYLTKVKQAGGNVLMFTGNPDGAHVKKYADYTVFVKATAYLAHRTDVIPTVQMMGNQYEQHLYMLCDIMIMLLTEELGLTYNDLEARHRNVE